MKEKVSNIFKSIMILILALLITPTDAYAANWGLENVELSDIVVDNNKITEYTVHFYINRYLGEAEGYIGIQNVPFVDRYDDNSYGDFTNFGKVAREKNFRKLSDVTSDNDFMNKYGIMGFSSENGEGFPIFGHEYRQIDRKFTDLNIELYKSGVYYVYLWTHWGTIYPDALIGTIEFDGTGKIRLNNSTAPEEKVYYILKYETNGGSSISSESIINEGIAAKPTNPTRLGYEFEGWYADELLETPFDFNTKITDNTTIYAKWKEILSFKGFDGLYDGEFHSVTIDGATDGYTILYSLDGQNYDLTEAPKYTDVGNYTVYYKVTKEGYEDLIGSVDINIKENKLEDSKNDETQDNQSEDVLNPKTGDTIIVWIVIGSLSYISLFIILARKILFHIRQKY